MKNNHVLSVAACVVLSFFVLCVVRCGKDSSTSPETGKYKIEGQVVDTNGKGVADVTRRLPVRM